MERMHLKFAEPSPEKMETFRTVLNDRDNVTIIMAATDTNQPSERPVEYGTLMDILANANDDMISGDEPDVLDVAQLGIELFLLSHQEVLHWPQTGNTRFYLVKAMEHGELSQYLNQSSYTGDKGGITLDRLGTMIETLCLKVGIPAHIQGYKYIHEAIRMVCLNPDVINRITGELYPSVATRFTTTPSKVERSIRHAINVVWNRGRIDSINDEFGYVVCSQEHKPTNGEFIALLSSRCR